MPASDSESGDTRQRILSAFMELLAERGLEATTTRALAKAAGVNEVTIFRHFGDKMTLAREAIRAGVPVYVLESYIPTFDVSTPASAADGLLETMRYMRRALWARRAVLQVGLGDGWRHPEVRVEVERAAMAARGVLLRAFDHARPALRPEVDIEASALGLQSLLVVTVIWQNYGWLTLTDDDWDKLFAANIRPLVRGAALDSPPHHDHDSVSSDER
jgi:AcrR family transcriptional regulator